MGNVCSSKAKKSNTKSSDERKASAESIPYGATDDNAANSKPAKDESSTSATQQASVHDPSQSVQPEVGGTKNSSTALSSCTDHVPLTGVSLSSASQTSASIAVGGAGVSSLSPVPPMSSSPSPYSTGATPANTAAAYQNISPIKGHLTMADYEESVRADSFTQIFPLRCDLVVETTAPPTATTSDDSQQSPTTPEPVSPEILGPEDFYVIAMSTESDEMIVWNVYEEKPARTMRAIPRPRDVRMVNPLRAVVLCNRELQLYDLDQARLVTKLKGVMNQKMPFYGLHNEKSVVALSRNRMYVNVLSLETGDLETTFKAGEDRFLNSLLTSANGKICVCGDETQKPFPLLVWDLINRKLLYDLRIPHHEFVTRLSAISDDGHYVVSVCKECNSSSPNFLIVYDLQSGTLFKKWKPEHNSVSVAMSKGCVINGTDNNDVLVWDLSTGNIKYTLSGHTAPPDLLQPAAKSNVVLTYNSTRKDSQLRVWCLDKGTCLWVFSPDRELSSCCLMPNGMTLVYGFVGEKSLQSANRSDPSESDAHNEQFSTAFTAEMCSKIVPYGQTDLQGQIVDLK